MSAWATQVGVVMFLAMIVLMAVRMPIAAAMFIPGVFGYWLMTDSAATLNFLKGNAVARLTVYELSVIPLFLLMGQFASQGGLSRDLFKAASALVGHVRGGLAMASLLSAGAFGAVCGSSVATSATITQVAYPHMKSHGYSGRLATATLATGGTLGILIPPSVPLVVYAILTEQNIAKLFAAAMVPGILAGLALILPTIWLSRRHGLGQGEASQERPPFWASMREAFWGLMAPFLILGGMRMGWFTPTEAAAVAVAYGLFVGMLVHRTIKVADLFPIFKEAAEISAVILLIIGLASIFAYSVNTLSIIDPITQAILQTGLGSTGALLLLVSLLLVVGMFLDGVSIFLIFVPLVMPLMRAYQWDPVWFGILLTMMVAVGQFTPPMAVNLMVSCKMAGVSMEQTFPWVWWLVLAMTISMLAVLFFPPLALWLPQYLGY